MKLRKYNIDITDNGIDLNEELDKIEKMMIEKALQKSERIEKESGGIIKNNIRFITTPY